jgi:hypothetical protein
MRRQRERSESSGDDQRSLPLPRANGEPVPTVEENGRIVIDVADVFVVQEKAQLGDVAVIFCVRAVDSRPVSPKGGAT